jgi:hypothetical protein
MVRFARSPCVAAVIVALGYSVQTAAQEVAVAAVDTTTTAILADAQAPQPTLSLGNPISPASPKRPAALVPLYASFVTLQVLDLHSTAYSIDRGAVETNPALNGFVDNHVAMAAVKAAGTAGLIFASEKLRTRNKAAALALMITSNVAMTWVVQHNYRAAR